MRIVVTGGDGFIGRHLCSRVVDAGHNLVSLDLKSGNDILRCKLPDCDRVFHLAAQTDAMLEDARADAGTNIMGLLRVLERYKSKVIFASSSMVNYPVSPYAITKLAGEHYTRFFGGSVVRFCNIFGPGGHSLIDRFASADELQIYGDGRQVRTFAHVDDAVSLLMEALRDQPGAVKVLRGTEYSVLDVASQYPDKPRRFVPSRRLDIVGGAQL